MFVMHFWLVGFKY